MKNNDIIPYCIPLLSDVEGFAASCKPLQDEENRVIIEDDIPFNDGRTIRRFSTQIRDIKDQYHGRFYIFEDITQRKEFENALKKSEEQFRSMFNSHSSIMLLIDPLSGEIKDANPAAVEFYGYPIDFLKGMNIDKINVLSPDDVAEERVKALRAQKNYFVFPHRLANGEARTVEVHSTPIALDNQKILFSIIHDITERKKAELEMQRKEKILSAVALSVKELLLNRSYIPAISNCFSLIGKATEVDRVYLFQNHFDENGVEMTSQKVEWNSETSEPQINNPKLQNLPFSDIQSFVAPLKSGTQREG